MKPLFWQNDKRSGKMDMRKAKFMEGFIRLTDDAFQKGWHERNGGNLIAGRTILVAGVP